MVCGLPEIRGLTEKKNMVVTVIWGFVSPQAWRFFSNDITLSIHIVRGLFGTCGTWDDKWGPFLFCAHD